MSAKNLIGRKKPVVEVMLDPDSYADEDWAAGVHELDKVRAALVKMNFNKAALGTTPGGLTHFIFWRVADNGNKLQFEEPNQADQWLVSIVCPPPRNWRKEKQKAAGAYVATAHVIKAAEGLSRSFRNNGIDPKGLLKQQSDYQHRQ